MHRHLKPDNIFITKDERVKILDFGLAKLAQPTAEGVALKLRSPLAKFATDPGTVMGTVGYMSPEQVRGQAVDHRTDIFSFCAVLYEMLPRRRAFRGDSAIETLNAILNLEPRNSLLPIHNVLRPRSNAWSGTAWRKLRKRRFQSANDVAFALDFSLSLRS